MQKNFYEQTYIDIFATSLVGFGKVPRRSSARSKALKHGPTDLPGKLHDHRPERRVGPAGRVPGLEPSLED